MSKNIQDDILEVLITNDQIMEKIKELGEMINKDYINKDTVLVSILKGSVVFLSDLLKIIKIPCSIDFIAVSSYGGNTESSGVVKLIMDLRESIQEKDVLLVEDIVDTGITMEYLKENLLTRHPKSFKICSLLSKVKEKKIDIDIDYVGFEIPDKFVVGYGLDYDELYRNLPYIGTLKPEIYRK
ncbi:hypoxanthine phosphoribosyltransferase [Elusimicrobiota bacterium]